MTDDLKKLAEAVINAEDALRDNSMVGLPEANVAAWVDAIAAFREATSPAAIINLISEMDEARRDLANTLSALQTLSSHIDILNHQVRVGQEEVERLTRERAAWMGRQEGAASVVRQLEEDASKLRAMLKEAQEVAIDRGWKLIEAYSKDIAKEPAHAQR